MSISFRFRYFFWHISASAALAVLLLFIVFGVWYPAPLSAAVGVTHIFLILLGVDVVLGPLLTLLVAKEFKKSLQFDLTIIIVIQFVALIYGMYVVAQGRPVWLVFNGDRFDLVQAYQLTESPYVEKAKAEYKRLSWLGPKWVAAKQPDGLEEKNNLIFEAVFAGVDVPQRPDLYISYEEGSVEIMSKALPLTYLNLYNPEADVAKTLRQWPEADAFLPMMCRVKPMTVLIESHSGEVIAIVNLNPWE